MLQVARETRPERTPGPGSHRPRSVRWVDGPLALAHHIGGRTHDPTVVLLHALGEQADSWDAVVAALAGSFRVVVPDLRGHGASGRASRYSLELMRDDVVALLDRLGLGHVILIGHSLGGIVALLVAQQYPDRVERLVLEDAPPPRPRSRPVPDRPEGPLSFDWAVVPAIVGQLDNPAPAWWDRLSSIRAPTLFVAGGPTSHVPQDQLAEAAMLVPDARLVTIPVGHEVHASSPEEFIAAVRAFLGADGYEATPSPR